MNKLRSFRTVLEIWFGRHPWLTNVTAEQGLADAQSNLGLMYYFGLGLAVHRNYKQAYIYFSLAAVKGDESAAKNRYLAATKLTPQNLAEARELASE